MNAVTYCAALLSVLISLLPTGSSRMFATVSPSTAAATPALAALPDTCTGCALSITYDDTDPWIRIDDEPDTAQNGQCQGTTPNCTATGCPFSGTLTLTNLSGPSNPVTYYYKLTPTTWGSLDPGETENFHFTGPLACTGNAGGRLEFWPNTLNTYPVMWYYYATCSNCPIGVGD